ncbi:MAG: hypothetical protein A2Z24_02360 [Candidatus Woykebacteria bacterium RBG_16_44_10]|uniref:ComEC/Rec2-related protein domain-containing protein n=1 Tax=Candidatus Woykebacteria bacterium RBG_16_44_10 TaxID=1802597 RepID=A0A1G1WE45_9BACT|nr:MAG: hypothetical protein A2Z24_02360 [Candidatus Woykebacteria bacterium RBG_16_44_10]
MRRLKTSSQSIDLKIVLALFLLVSLLIWRFSTANHVVKDGHANFTATLIDEPQIYNQWQYFDIEGYRVKTSSEAEYSYGDKLKIEGNLENGRLTNPEIEKLGTSKFHSSLFSIRQSLKRKIFGYFSEPAASLLSGILLGSKEDLPTGFEESLRRTGTIHVVVVSGYNISVLAGVLIGLSRFIKRKIALVLALIAITFYTLLVGADPPAVRAAIMGSLTFSAVFLGRQRFSLYFLALAAYLMLFINPVVLVNIGFQLSFLATAGIILFREKILNFLKSIPRALNDDLSTTLAAQILVVPVLFYHFGSVSAISVVANAAILWTIPIATVAGFVFLIASLIVPLLATLISWIIWAVLYVFIALIGFFERVPFAYFEFSPKQILPLLGYYLGLFVLLIYIRYGRVAKK